MGLNQYKGISGTATTIESSYNTNVRSVKLIANDSLTGNLYVSFGGSIDEFPYIKKRYLWGRKVLES
jgi:hypothetical protein